MPIIPAHNQKQGFLGSPPHSHMLLYPYVDVSSLHSQNFYPSNLTVIRGRLQLEPWSLIPVT